MDARTGRRAPDDDYAFDIPHRNEDARRKHQIHLGAVAPSPFDGSRRGLCRHGRRTLRATRGRAICSRGGETIRFFTGPHWISGIEIGIRLIAWVWIRRLLNGWKEPPSLFEKNPQFIGQLHHHQEWLAALPSRGSSANNHLVAEAAGQFVAASCVPGFQGESRLASAIAQTCSGAKRWRRRFRAGSIASSRPSTRALVLELFLAAAIEGELSGIRHSDRSSGNAFAR